MSLFEGIIARFAASLPDDPALSRQRLVVVNAPDAFFTSYLPIRRAADGLPEPATMLALAVGTRPFTLVRADARTLIVAMPSGFYREGTDLGTRSFARPFAEGDAIDLGDVRITVSKVDARGVPVEARFVFATSLDDAAWRFVTWRGPAFVPFALPPEGVPIAVEAQRVSL
jgi:hypothetical protein